MKVKTTYPQIVKNLLLLSLLILIIDAFLGLEIFVLGSTNLVIVYKISYVLKFILCIYIFLKSFKIRISKTSFAVILFAIVNILRSFSDFDTDVFITSLYFYLMIIIGIESGKKIHRLALNPAEYTPSKFIVNFIYFIVQVLIGIYFLLFANGTIVYFGMGLQLYLFLPFWKKNIIKKQSYLTILSLFTGKRSSILILLIQLIGSVKNKIKFQKSRLILVLFFIIFVSSVIKDNTSLLERFDVFSEFTDTNLTKIDDEDALFAWSMMTGGRSQEIFSYLASDLNTNLNMLIGSPSTSSFIVDNNLNSEYYNHHYFHLSPMNYIKHFGLIFGLILFLTQLKIFLKLFNNFNQLDIISSLFVGYFLAMFFGAIVVIDILFWFSFGYSLEFCENKIK